MIILASNSPRRKELMEKYVTSSFLIEPSDIDESIYQDIDPIKTVEQTAKAKGEYIFQKNHDDIIISADTIVVIDNQILGKPKNRNDAIKMLMMMKGKRHEVITSYYIVNKNKSILRSVISFVTLKDVEESVIERYVDEFPPLDKAGSYGIQDEYFKNNTDDEHYRWREDKTNNTGDDNNFITEWELLRGTIRL